LKNELTPSQRICRATEIPFDMMTAMPYIKMCSNREITVEDAGKLLHYDKETVKVMQGKNAVIITGNNLNVRCLANDDIRVDGCIRTIAFES